MEFLLTSFEKNFEQDFQIFQKNVQSICNICNVLKSRKRYIDWLECNEYSFEKLT